jgi:hypothetical protein
MQHRRESVDVVNVSSLPPDSEGQPSRSEARARGHVGAKPRRHISSS